MAVTSLGSARVELIDRDGQVSIIVRGTPADTDPRELTVDHLFDLASVTKAVVAMTALALYDDGLLDLDEPVVAHLPVASVHMTPRSLLTHSAGLPASHLGWRDGGSGEELRAQCIAAPVSDVGRHRYSCVGFIILGSLIETLTGRPLADLVQSKISGPVGARTLRFGPVDEGLAVATEERPQGGTARGTVHDELAAAIGFPVGNAGLFGTAGDLLAVGRLLRDGGAGPSGRVLSSESVRLLTEAAVPADGYGQALGLRVGERAWMGEGTRRVGHTGFTGTAFAVDPTTETVGILLTNRVHPRRPDPAGIRRARREFFDAEFAARP